jgi:biotin synthase
MTSTQIPTRYDWSYQEIAAYFDLPFNDLIFQAQSIHREIFDPNKVQLSTLLSIKTGKCPEDCAYCSQSNRYDTGLSYEELMEVEAVVEAAKEAKAAGSERYCMGAAWRSPKGRDMAKVTAMVKGVKALGMETCMTLGMLNKDQANELAEAGLDYYNHNLDTSPEYYKQIISTRKYQDRLDTLQHVRDAGMKTCAGGIVGMGETRDDRIGFLQQLANLPAHPDSVPINQLVKIEGTPLDLTLEEQIDSFEFIRMIAIARILMPYSYVRLSAGRETMNDEMQALAFFAGANSLFYGDRLLTTDNPESSKDRQLFKRLGINNEEHVIDDLSDDGLNGDPQTQSVSAGTSENSLFYNAV